MSCRMRGLRRIPIGHIVDDDALHAMLVLMPKTRRIMFDCVLDDEESDFVHTIDMPGNADIWQVLDKFNRVGKPATGWYAILRTCF